MASLERRDSRLRQRDPARGPHKAPLTPTAAAAIVRCQPTVTVRGVLVGGDASLTRS